MRWCFGLMMGFCVFVFAGEAVNKSWRGVAVKGYDVVAYFQEKMPVKGSDDHVHTHMGAKYYFSSAANRDLFKADPEKYLPQYGGYCAWAVSQGDKADIDPKAWKIVDGKLYLNYNAKIQKKWEKDIPGLIAAADKNWPGLSKK